MPLLLNTDDMSFLEELGSAENATLKAVLPDGQVCTISDNVCPFKFLDHCPLLYHAFESDEHGRLQASIEATSTSSVISLLRFCYTGSYLPVGLSAEFFSLLQHAEVYKLASNFDVPELQLLAHGNFSCQIECACSLPNPPEELPDTIRFVYKYFANYGSRQEHGLVNTLLNYCVSVYHYHKLGQNKEFLDVVAEISTFCQDLCRTNIARDFADDCASDIIRLHSNPTPTSDFSHTALYSENIPSGMFHNTYNVQCTASPLVSTSTYTNQWDATNLQSDTANATSLPSSDACSTSTLALRPKASRPVTCPDSDTETVCKNCSTSITSFWRRDDMDAALCNTCWSFWRLYGRSRPILHKHHLRNGARTSVQRGFASSSSSNTTSNTGDLYWNTPPKIYVTDTPGERTPQGSAKDSLDEYDGFAIVHLPESPVNTTLDETMSSPELIPSIPLGKAPITHVDSSSDDDWIVLEDVAASL